MNESAREFQKTTFLLKIEWIFLAALGGMLLGAFVLLIFQLPMKFTYYLIAGPIILFVAIMTRRLKRFFQGVLIFVIPLNYPTHFFRRPYLFGTTGLDFSPLDIVLIVLYAIWLYELFVKKSGSFRLFAQVTIPALSLVGVSALSMLVASDPYLALYETVRIFKAVLLLLYVANHIQSRRDISFVLVILLGGLFLQSLIAFSQKWLDISLGLNLFGEYQQMGSVFLTHEYYITVARVGGTIGHANGLAKYVELLIPLSMVLLFTEIKLRHKLAGALVFICAFVVLLLTLSRGGWVCFTGSILLIFLLIFRAKLIRLQTLVAIAMIAFIFTGVFLSFSGLVTSRLLGDDYGAAYSRIPLSKVALKIIKDHPLLGVGSQNYWKYIHLYDPNLEPIPATLVHNAYLLVASEMGIPGLLILLWFLSSIFWLSLGNLKIKDTFLVCLNVGFLAGIAALLAHYLVDRGYIADFSVFWVSAGMIVAIKELYRKRQLMPTEADKTSQ